MSFSISNTTKVNIGRNRNIKNIKNIKNTENVENMDNKKVLNFIKKMGYVLDSKTCYPYDIP